MGHRSHTKNIEVIDYARENGIKFFSLPPHTSHKLQPLYRTFFKPLNVAFNTACGAWMRQHSTRRITVDKLGEISNTAYLKAATIDSAVSGFHCTGIVPFEPSILPESEYLINPRQTDFTVGSSSSSSVSTAIASSNPNAAPVTTSSLSKLNNLPGTNDTGNISFSDIQKVPNIVEKKKSNRSII